MEGSALLAAIRDAPDDDDPRLVYADWLTQQGDPLGELIALQVRVARADATDQLLPERSRIAARIEKLLGDHQTTWVAPLRAIERAGYSFERGMPEHISSYHGPPIDQIAARLCEAGAVLYSATLTGEMVGRLLLTPASAAFRKVSITMTEPPPPGALEEIARCVPDLHSLAYYGPWPDRLDELQQLAGRLENLALEPHGDVAILAALPASLRSLKLDRFRADQLAGLAGSHLTSLTINGTKLEPDELEAILAVCPNLVRLRLQKAGLGEEAAHVIARSPLCRQLRRLDLTGNALGEAIGLLADAPFDALVSLALTVTRRSAKRETVARLRARFAAIALDI